jgi:hypothetical protein
VSRLWRTRRALLVGGVAVVACLAAALAYLLVR